MKSEEMGKAARKWIVDNYSMESLWQTKRASLLLVLL